MTSDDAQEIMPQAPDWAPGSPNPQAEAQSKSLTINTEQSSTMTIALVGKHSPSSETIKQESVRNDHEHTGEMKSRKEVTRGDDTDCAIQAASQPDHSTNADDTASPAQPDITTYGHGDQCDPVDEVDQEVKEVGLAEAESEIARQIAETEMTIDEELRVAEEGPTIADEIAEEYSMGSKENDRRSKENDSLAKKIDRWTEEKLEIAVERLEIAKEKLRIAKEEVRIAKKKLEIVEGIVEIAEEKLEIAEGRVGIAEERLEIAGKHARFCQEAARSGEEHAGRSVDKARVCQELELLLRENARLKLHKLNLDAIVHMDRGDGALVAMSKVGLGNDPLKARQLTEVCEGLERIYEAGRRPSHEEIETLFKEAGAYEGISPPL